MSPTFSALSVRNYRLFFTGMLASNTGTWMQRVAQDWLVLTLTGGSGAALGVTMGLQFAPYLLFSLWGGKLADRMRRRSLLMVTQGAMGLLALVLATLTLTGNITITMLYALSLALGIISALDAPARQAFVAELVGRDRLTNAVALNSASFNLGRVGGPAIAGLLIAAIGTGWVFLINGVSFGAAIVALALIRMAELASPATRGKKGEVRLRDGITYLRGRADLMLVLAVVAAVGTFGFNFPLTLAMMARVEFGGTAASLGLLSTSIAVGSLAGSLLAARRGAPPLALVASAAIGFSILEMGAALMPSVVTLALWMPLVGFAALTFSTAAQSYVQLHCAPEMRGRVMGVYLLLFFGGTPFGAPLLGWIADTAGPRWTLGLGGLAVLVVVAISALVMRTRAGEAGRVADASHRREEAADAADAADAAGALDASEDRSVRSKA